MTQYKKVGEIQVAQILFDFINHEVLKEAELEEESFWKGFEQIVTTFSARNKTLLEKRKSLQNQISKWHEDHQETNPDDYMTFLKDIGYLEEEVEDFTVQVDHVDQEITHIGGPQLVVPINNPRYAINAANARWGSLYDAYYGTDLISEENGQEKGLQYNPKRGEQVIEKSKTFLNENFPLEGMDYQSVTAFSVENGQLICRNNNTSTNLSDSKQFIGYQGEASKPTALLLEHNNLHVEILFDENHPIGKTDPAHIKDVVVESAITTIMDCEDSITAVDAEDKVDVYRNWKGLVRGELSTAFKKGDKILDRTFNEDKSYTTPSGETTTLSGRVLMLNRNVGHLMTNDAVLLSDGTEAYEGILDGIITSAIAKQNLLGKGKYINSKAGSIYIVKPKMHGSEEVAFTNDLFNAVEDLLNLSRYTVKMGIMDEERRTSINLKNCIYEAKNRVIFINTGYLDRTGDEIHTSMIAGPMNRTGDMKNMTWNKSYEINNVETGLKAGLQEQAQIGKGMWAMPDEMKQMVVEKINHVRAGANTAWVPSPTAATLHALHYHMAYVPEVQNEIKANITSKDYRPEILQIPVEKSPTWTAEEIKEEIDNHIQKILGYVVRWVEQGIGCSKVPNIHDIGMMEDRATLRISSQLVANWLRHGICSEKDVRASFERLAQVVDEQNADDPAYHKMSPDYNSSTAFQAATELVFNAETQPNGYTEPILHQKRLEFKKKAKVLN